MTHLPKNPLNPYCHACQRTKMVNVKSFRREGIQGYDFTNLANILHWAQWSCVVSRIKVLRIEVLMERPMLSSFTILGPVGLMLFP